MKVIYTAAKECLSEKSFHIFKYICSYCGHSNRGMALHIYDTSDGMTYTNMEIMCKDCQAKRIQYREKIPYII